MPTPSTPIPIKEMSEFLAVDPTSSTGLRWLASPLSRTKAGDEAGCINSNGYFRIKFKSKDYLAHRVVYALHHNVDPGPLQIDHIDRDRLNNVVANLRLVTNRGNHQNKTNHGDLPVGVLRSAQGKPYMARIRLNDRKVHLGRFNTSEEASAAYQKALAELAPSPVACCH